MLYMVNNNLIKLKFMIIYIYLIIKLFIIFCYIIIKLVKMSFILVFIIVKFRSVDDLLRVEWGGV